MGGTIARIMLRWLELLINRYCCIYLVVYITCSHVRADEIDYIGNKNCGLMNFMYVYVCLCMFILNTVMKEHRSGPTILLTSALWSFYYWSFKKNTFQKIVIYFCTSVGHCCNRFCHCILYTYFRTYFLNVKWGDFQLMVSNFCIRSYSCIMDCW